MVLLVVAVVVGYVLWKVAGFGDSLHGWHSEWDRLRDWRRRAHRRGASPYLWAVALVAAGWVLVTVPAARGAAGLGGVTAGSVAWAVVRLAMRFWPVLATVAVALALVHQRQRSKRRMRGEVPDRRGKARAALLDLVQDAVAETLPTLGSKSEGRSPIAGAPSFFATTVAGRTREWGVRVQVHMRHGSTIAALRKFSSDGTDPEHDRMATSVEASLRDFFAERTPEARQVLAASPTRPVFPYTALVPVRTKGGQVNPGYAALLVLRDNPLRSTYRYPKARPKVRHLGDPVLVGITMDAAEAKATIRESHTAVWGQSGSGKSFFQTSMMIGASQCPHVAFVVIDMKGVRGDLTAMAPRAAAVVTSHEGATVALEWLVDEMDRRAASAGPAGKITKFSADLPEIVVWADEWHEWLYEIPDKDHAARRFDAFERLVRRARAFGVYVVAGTQITYASDGGSRRSMGAVTGQFTNVVTTRLASQAHTTMVWPPGTFSQANGPHHIPPSWKGVAYGRFGEDGEVTMIKSLLSGPEVAARWAQVDAKAGLRVELPGLEGALAAADTPPMLAAPAAVPAQAKAGSGDELALQSLPHPVAEAVVYFAGVLGVDVPEDFTERSLRDFGTKGLGVVSRSKGADDGQRQAADSHREAIRSFLNPNT